MAKMASSELSKVQEASAVNNTDTNCSQDEELVESSKHGGHGGHGGDVDSNIKKNNKK